ncbi:MAG: helix-turn-helix domain-containing protein [Halobacteriovoraceae bacterium]|nr:helix-turn-helix domain-containing protein [Halobacteriovoraceae bacterium]MCB9095378.1 helix-turn-helix domain-containing protein [Halobacteriovoraceae bacterium]
MNNKIINEYKPDYVSPPGETLEELLDDRGMSQKEFADRAGRPLKTINEIVKGKTAITPETAIQFERVLGVPAEFWNSRESNYRQYLAEIDERNRLEEHKGWLMGFPVREMINKSWLKDKGRNTIEQSIELLNFFGVASPNQWRATWKEVDVSFKRSSVYQSKLESVSAWLRKGEIEATNIFCQKFDKQKFKNSLEKIRGLSLETDPNVFVPKLTELCSESGVAVVFVPALKGVPVCGSARWLGADKALIQLSLRFKSNDHLWFSFFHEAAHILLHSKKMIFVELNSNGTSDSSDLEDEANNFSSNHLISKSRYKELIEGESFSKSKIIEFANSIGIAPGIVVGRLQHDGIIPFNRLNELKVKYEWE